VVRSALFFLSDTERDGRESLYATATAGSEKSATLLGERARGEKHRDERKAIVRQNGGMFWGSPVIDVSSVSREIIGAR
jgi:hypothetical protein